MQKRVRGSIRLRGHWTVNYAQPQGKRNGDGDGDGDDHVICVSNTELRHAYLLSCPSYTSAKSWFDAITTVIHPHLQTRDDFTSTMDVAGASSTNDDGDGDGDGMSSSCYSSSFDDVLSREHWCVLRRNVTPYYALNGVFNHVADLALNTAGWKLCDVQNNIQSFEKMEMAMGMVKSVACVHAPIELVASLLGMNHHHHHRHQYHHHHYPFSEYVESHQLGPKLYEV